VQWATRLYFYKSSDVMPEKWRHFIVQIIVNGGLAKAWGYHFNSAIKIDR
jgi:hypothetical protein